MKISQRLQQIDNMITQRYDHIWDCCCDHGFLGVELLKRNAATTVHFVDVVAPLMAQLQTKLEQFFPDESSANSLAENSWQVHCLDVARLQFYAPERNLIIIAGVGGDLLIELVDKLIQAHPQHELEFVLCPVRHNYKVRQALAAMGLGLVNESLVHENKLFYEIIHVSTYSTTHAATHTALHTLRPISPVGSMMWDLSRSDDRNYLNRTIEHYQRMSKSGNQNAQGIVSDYQSLLTR